MKFRLRILILCAALLLLAGCSRSGNIAATQPTTSPIQTVSPEAARDLYQQALDKLTAEENYKLTITTSKSTAVGIETLSETHHQVLVYNHLGTSDMRASMKETCTIGTQKTAIEELYAKNTGYFTVNGSCFMGSITAKEYIARYTPAAPLDITLYDVISAQEKNGVTSIRFNQPSRAEGWVLPDGAQMLSAAGSCILDSDGMLSESTYDIVYAYGPATVTLTVTAAVELNATPSVDIPADTSAYVPLTYLDAPRMLEQACGYMLQSTTLSAHSTSSITSQISGIYRVQSEQLHMDSQDSSLAALLTTSVNVTDYSLGGDTSTYTQQESFLDGQYSIAVGNKQPTADSEVTSAQMKAYCQDILVGNVLLPEHLSDAVLTDLGSVYLLELTATDALAQIMNENACQILYADPQFLNSLSPESRITSLNCYLAIDKYTGFPTAAGLSCGSEHTIEDLTYTFSTQADTAYSLASLTTRPTITGEPLKTPGSTQSTPLFYQVTGENGRKLWLFGTMHIGDARANNLPQEIYDALNHADALAVEFDISTAETKTAAGSQLQAALSQAYYYADGTTANHLDPALYETALKLMKASGSYTAETLALKPVFWESKISDFYIRQGYHLTTEQGVDAHLIQQAKAAGKEILEIESLLSQTQMLGNLSDPLQAALLEETIAYDGFSYRTEAQELFDLWCQGNLAALRSALAADLPEDAALCDEYTNALLTQRNAAMLAAATEYLEGDKTVFFAVGLAHLLGDDGLLKTLADTGFTVTRVTYS